MCAGAGAGAAARAGRGGRPRARSVAFAKATFWAWIAAKESLRQDERLRSAVICRFRESSTPPGGTTCDPQIGLRPARPAVEATGCRNAPSERHRDPPHGSGRPISSAAPPTTAARGTTRPCSAVSSSSGPRGTLSTHDRGTSSGCVPVCRSSVRCCLRIGLGSRDPRHPAADAMARTSARHRALARAHCAACRSHPPCRDDAPRRPGLPRRPFTSLALTAVELGRRGSLSAAVVALDHALRAGVPLEDLRALAESVGPWGGVRVERALDIADVRHESVGESYFAGACSGTRLPGHAAAARVPSPGRHRRSGRLLAAGAGHRHRVRRPAKYEDPSMLRGRTRLKPSGTRSVAKTGSAPETE